MQAYLAGHTQAQELLPGGAPHIAVGHNLAAERQAAHTLAAAHPVMPQHNLPFMKWCNMWQMQGKKHD